MEPSIKHDNYMTDKEKRYVTNFHKKNIIRNNKIYNYRMIFYRDLDKNCNNDNIRVDNNDNKKVDRKYDERFEDDERIDLKDEERAGSKDDERDDLKDDERVDFKNNIDKDNKNSNNINKSKVKSIITPDLTAKIKALFKEHEYKSKLNAKKSLKPPRIKIKTDYHEKNDLFYKLKIEELADKCLKIKYKIKDFNLNNKIINTPVNQSNASINPDSLNNDLIDHDDSIVDFDFGPINNQEKVENNSDDKNINGNDLDDFEIENFSNLIKIKKFFPLLRELLSLKKKGVILSILNNSHEILPKKEVLEIFEEFYDHFPVIYFYDKKGCVIKNDENNNTIPDYNSNDLESVSDNMSSEFTLVLKTNSPFLNNFIENGTGLTLGIILLLKNPELSTHFYKKIMEMPIRFLDNSDEFIWKFLTILVSNLGEEERKNIVFMMKDRIYECLSEKKDLDNINMFLEAIGIEGID
ncbi:hypothetical protein DMUE_2117 [Dictyocoela muelleri]|nr:hypothetical protein DMUE_2117 [Dictyocoela muelleri]